MILVLAVSRRKLHWQPYFCPGSAYRDDTTLERAVSDIDVCVKSFRLDTAGVFSNSTAKVGKALIEKRINAPYAEYIDECRRATVVVIAVANGDKPAGLTSLLECMALGKPVIISNEIPVVITCEIKTQVLCMKKATGEISGKAYLSTC